VTIDAIIKDLIVDKTTFDLDEKQKQTLLTEEGSEKIEEIMETRGLFATDTTGLYDAANITLVHHINQALRANTLYQKDKDYIIKAGEIMLIDEFTGRMMTGRRLSEGLHQAIEAKEGVDHAREPDPGLGDDPELLPPLRKAVRHDRHGRDRGAGVPRHLQDGRAGGADEPARQAHRPR
jgi:preprotein translocase subunit SecA